MITLQPHDLCWTHGAADDPQDQCAHGKVEFTIDGAALIAPSYGEWTLSAAALYLLRALSDDHSRENPVAEDNFLFPCCGFTVWLTEGRYRVMCMGCSHGIEIYIRHESSAVHITSGERCFTVLSQEWHAAVIGFADQIESYYARCSPKAEPDDLIDREGWTAFWSEWRERRGNWR